MSLTISEELSVKCCPECGISYAAPKSYFVERYENGGNWHCPNGHKLHFTETKVGQLEKQLGAANNSLEREKQWHRDTSRELDYQKNLTRGQKAAKTKAQNKLKRIKDGLE